MNAVGGTVHGGAVGAGIKLVMTKELECNTALNGNI